MKYRKLKVEWRDVVGYEGEYQVSNTGMVRSLDRVVGGCGGSIRKICGMTLKQIDNSKGYLYVNLRGKVRVYVHRLVLEVFVGSCPEGMECCHEDDDKSNNNLENLRWDTHSVNMSEIPYPPTGKLTREQVVDIRSDYLPGLCGVIAKKYGVSKVCIYDVVNGKTWSSI